MRSDASNSITMLKQKFDEIKRNINTIEQKQKEFFSQGLTESKGLTQERYQRSSNINRFSDIKPKEIDRNDNLLKALKDIEGERLVLYRKLDDYKRENEDLKEENFSYENKLKILQMENQQLKARLEKYENPQEKRPQSCIRDSRSPPKNNRVAFSKELTSIYHIDDQTPLSKAFSKPLRNSGAYISPIQSRNTYNSLRSTPSSDKLYEHEVISKQRRIGLD